MQRSKVSIPALAPSLGALRRTRLCVLQQARITLRALSCAQAHAGACAPDHPRACERARARKTARQHSVWMRHCLNRLQPELDCHAPSQLRQTASKPPRLAAALARPQEEARPEERAAEPQHQLPREDLHLRGGAARRARASFARDGRSRGGAAAASAGATFETKENFRNEIPFSKRKDEG